MTVFLAILGMLARGVAGIFGVLFQYRGAIAIIFGVIGLGIGCLIGQQLEHAKWKNADLVAALEAKTRDADIARAAAADATARESELRAQADALTAKVTEYENALAQKPPPAGCKLSPDDIRRLQSIR